MVKAGWMIAASYLEWIRWVATGRLRCSGRLVWVSGESDQEGFDALMDRSPDFKVNDDQAYVLARIAGGVMSHAEPILASRGLGDIWLPIEAVLAFHPLSERGSRLLAADAERACARLSEPAFEPRWVNWRDRRIEECSRNRGGLLCQAMGLDAPTFGRLPEQAESILFGMSPLPNAERARDHGLGGTRAFGWAAALSVIRGVDGGAEALKHLRDPLGPQAMLKALMADFDVNRPLLSDTAPLDIADELERLLPDRHGPHVSIAMLAVAFHYRELAMGGKEISLPSLVTDLTKVAVRDPAAASQCAYAIGRAMEDVAVTTLLYRSHGDRFRSLKSTAINVQMNVGERVASIPRETAVATETSSSVAASPDVQETDSTPAQPEAEEKPVVACEAVPEQLPPDATVGSMATAVEVVTAVRVEEPPAQTSGPASEVLVDSAQTPDCPPPGEVASEDAPTAVESMPPGPTEEDASPPQGLAAGVAGDLFPEAPPVTPVAGPQLAKMRRSPRPKN